MNNLAYASISELKKLLVEKKITAAELVDFYHARIKALDPQLNALIEVFDVDSIHKNSATEGLLAGIPGLIKDNIAQRDRKLSCASNILKDYTSMYDATAVSRLKSSGALLLGRANLDEFAMGSSTETSAFGNTKNPWDFSRVPGGSSGGSAAAVAAGLAPWALGSDTGGSVRQPAAFCGIVGVKPTYGLVSRSGLVAYASSLDQIGVFSRSVHDAATVLSAIAGTDEKDQTTVRIEPQDYTKTLDGKLPENFTLGIVDHVLDSKGLDQEVSQSIKAAIAEFEKMGAKIKRIEMPALDYATAAYFVLSRAEAASNLARFDGVRYGFRSSESGTLEKMYSNSRNQGFGTEVKTRIMVGNYVLSAGHSADFYKNAKHVQGMIRHEFINAFKDVDLIVMPTHSAPAFKFGAFDVDKLQMDLQDYFTCPINLGGIPAMSIPCGFTSNKLPIGFQLLAPHLGEHTMFKAAYAYEQRTPWHTMHPDL